MKYIFILFLILMPYKAFGESAEAEVSIRIVQPAQLEEIDCSIRRKIDDGVFCEEFPGKIVTEQEVSEWRRIKIESEKR